MPRDARSGCSDRPTPCTGSHAIRSAVGVCALYIPADAAVPRQGSFRCGSCGHLRLSTIDTETTGREESPATQSLIENHVRSLLNTRLRSLSRSSRNAACSVVDVMPGRLQDRIAIVTGAGCVGPGWGNGRAIAVLFAREGATILAVDKSASAMEETLDRVREVGGLIEPHVCDVTDGASVAAMVEACRAHFGRIDILVNNVGGSAAGGPVELAEAVWDAQVDSNLKSVFLTCKYVLPMMEAQGRGVIVNMSSSSAMRWTGAAQVAYAATKAGVIQFSRVVAVQYAEKGIRVNTVIPGQLHTPMVEARLAGQRTGGDVEALLKQRVARIPLGFMGDGRDTANAVLFLASDDARFVTGTEIIVDGGMTARCD
jgi:NAD(P)-dependent dehydrogenase (short-subunit alcohol dehydrogenase family)